MNPRFFLLLLLIGIYRISYGQDSSDISKSPLSSDSLDAQKDLMDVFRKWFHKEPKEKKPSLKTTAILPAIAYNPSIGFGLGINFVRSSYRGDPATTKLSIGQFDVFVTTKKIVQARLRHNTFTKNNRWNFQGNFQYQRGYIADYGLGEEAAQDPPVSYPIRMNYFRLTEKAFRALGNNFYAGIGLSFDIRGNIDADSADQGTPNYRYSVEHGINPTKNQANGIILNFQYNTKEHPNRSFGGIYSEVNFRYNANILGSTREAGQLYTEFRKYFSLSKKYPENVLAFWYWGSFLLWGELPYLELPCTAYDTYNRSGRGYTFSRFKGDNFVYGEVEWRFPISQVSKLFSGVVFANFQTASDGKDYPLFERIDPAYGAGLRIQFNKRSRTNICLDYGFGRYGSRGFFFSLNEAF